MSKSSPGEAGRQAGNCGGIEWFGGVLSVGRKTGWTGRWRRVDGHTTGCCGVERLTVVVRGGARMKSGGFSENQRIGKGEVKWCSSWCSWVSRARVCEWSSYVKLLPGSEHPHASTLVAISWQAGQGLECLDVFVDPETRRARACRREPGMIVMGVAAMEELRIVSSLKMSFRRWKRGMSCTRPSRTLPSVHTHLIDPW